MGEARDATGARLLACSATPCAGYRNGYRKGRATSVEGAIEFDARQRLSEFEITCLFVAAESGSAGRGDPRCLGPFGLLLRDPLLAYSDRRSMTRPGHVEVGLGSGPPDFCPCTLKVPRSPVGSGSGRPEPARPMSQLGRLEPDDRRLGNGRNRRYPAVGSSDLKGRKPPVTAIMLHAGPRPATAPRRAAPSSASAGPGRSPDTLGRRSGTIRVQA